MKRFIIYIAILACLEISCALYLTYWRELFWNYVEARNFHGFCVQIGVFTILALVFCFVSAYGDYFTTICAIKWREVLNNKMLNIKVDVENFNQRLQEDCASYPYLFLSLIFGLGKAVIYVAVFSISLVINFNLIYLGIIVVYAVISTFVARRIAKPLIELNYTTQQAEATYRNFLTSLNFNSCIEIVTQLAIKTKQLAYFQTFYGQLAVILPILIASPAYFSSVLTLGALMRATSLMGTITDNLSFGITSFNSFNKFKSCRRRLQEVGLFDKN